MAKGLMEEGWELYRKVIPAQASEVQVTETRTAFYAGASYLFAQMMLRLDPDKDKDPTDGDMAVLDGIHEELMAFVRSKGG